MTSNQNAIVYTRTKEFILSGSFTEETEIWISLMSLYMIASLRFGGIEKECIADENGICLIDACSNV
jgi:hypothetical protein